MGFFKSVARKIDSATSGVAQRVTEAGASVANKIAEGGTRNLEPARLTANTVRGTFGIARAAIQGAGGVIQDTAGILSNPANQGLFSVVGGAFGVPVGVGGGYAATPAESAAATPIFLPSSPDAAPASGGLPTWAILAAVGAVGLFIYMRSK